MTRWQRYILNSDTTSAKILSDFNCSIRLLLQILCAHKKANIVCSVWSAFIIMYKHFVGRFYEPSHHNFTARSCGKWYVGRYRRRLKKIIINEQLVH